VSENNNPRHSNKGVFFNGHFHGLEGLAASAAEKVAASWAWPWLVYKDECPICLIVVALFAVDFGSMNILVFWTGLS
jgi:hypothetical protein